MIRRYLAAACSVVVVSCALIALPATAASAAPVCCTNVLHAGESAMNQLSSASKEFELFMFCDSLDLEQSLPWRQGTTSVNVWGTPQADPSCLQSGTLSMQTDGNLVLRTPSGKVAWQSHTSGTGANNTFTVSDTGSLNVRTDTGHIVWQSGSGRAMLISGMTLRSTQFLRSRYDDTKPWVRLAMQPDGNLVLSYNKQARWTSNTHVAGSRLIGMPDGNWAIYSPTNHLVWAFGSAGHGKTYLFALPAGTEANLQINSVSRLLVNIQA